MVKGLSQVITALVKGLSWSVIGITALVKDCTGKGMNW